MNFIGHAAVALARRTAARFVLGAMLPDFASMARASLGEIRDPELRAGVELHHHTDTIFHGCDHFVRLTRTAVDRLVQGGVARGPARAVAHVGVEMFIDGELLQRAELCAAYLSALAAWQELPPPALEGSGNHALGHLRQGLMLHGIPYDYRCPEAVTARLCKMLAPRPRLALTPAAQSVVGSIMPDLQRHVQNVLPELLENLLRGLSHPSYSSAITS